MSISLSKLPLGITTAFDSTDKVEFTEFKKVCYQASQGLGLKIHNFWKCMESKTERKGVVYDNYHMAHMDEIFVLCNSGYPYIGFVESSIYDNKPFVDKDDWAEYFSVSKRFQILSAEFLNSPIVISKKDLVDNKLFSDLDESEHRDIRYWEPSVVGQAIFNDWD